jgi:probable rRNA maturation factor
VSFISDPVMRHLNRTYRGKDTPTDVLSFSQLEGPDQGVAPASLGDVVISADTVVRQAKEYRVTPAQETLRLLIHGLLHLFGFDHERVSAARRQAMQRMEDYLYARHVDAVKSWVSGGGL